MKKEYIINLHEDRRGFWVAQVEGMEGVTCTELDVADALKTIGFMLWQRRQELSIR